MIKKTCLIKCKYCNADLELTRRIVKKDKITGDYSFKCHVCNCNNVLKEDSLPNEFLLSLD